MNKSFLNKSLRTKRRGVGAIIAGVILAAILVTTVLVYFVTILNNEKARTSYQLQAEQENRDKETESFTVLREDGVPFGNLDVTITNVGPIPMVVSQGIIYCTNCAEAAAPKVIEPLSIVLNPGEKVEDLALGDGLLVNGENYRLDVISERGNFNSAPICELEDGVCVEDDDPPIPPGLQGIVTEGIIQGTGSLQLDFKSFGALYPTFGTRNGVDQTGWSVKAANATGYPASSIAKANSVVLVERMRNLDPSTENITMTRQTGLSITLGKAQGNTPTIVYICSETPGTPGSFSAYTTDTKTLPYSNPMTAGKYGGFTDVFFCAQDEQASTPLKIWDPTSDSKFDNINGIFMVARGYFGAKSDFYSQVVPYQSLYIAALINSCLKTELSSNSTACPATMYAPATDNANYVYSAPSSSLSPGPLTATVRLEGTIHGKYSVDWV
ncbi:MAG: hypothetical protein MN733_18205, partial [Nitrososphaera sp.]|nr:hypothetical protein [Nitrososphaera sp.]